MSDYFRKTFLLASLLLLAGLFNVAQAAWPDDRPIKFIIPFGPGGFDAYARTLAPVLEEILGAVVVPENVPGAGGRIGANAVYRARPDGYTIGLWSMPGMTIPGIMGERVRYDLDKLTWIAQLSFAGYGLAVAADSDLHTFADLCDLGRPASFAAQGGYTETASIATIITMAEVGCPYKLVTGYQGSSQATLAVMRGDVDARINPIGTLMPYIESGDIRVLVTFEDERTLAGVPTIADLGHPEYIQFGVRRVVAAPPGLPEPIRERLEAAFLQAMQTPRVVQWSERTNNPFSPLDSRATTDAMREVTAFYARYADLLREEFSDN
jgi:tripartite-type tricarboxylate transporter receptor subunit TctC